MTFTINITLQLKLAVKKCIIKQSYGKTITLWRKDFQT